MGQVVAGYGVSHTAMMISEYQPGTPSHERVYAAFDTIRRELEALRPDALVVFGTDHLNSFDYSCLPQLCVGIGETCSGWGDGGVPSATMPLASDLAAQVLRDGVASGFDVAFAANPRIDHAFMAPLHLLCPSFDLPIVPIFQNTSTPPIAPLRRSAEVGRLVARVVAARPDERIAVLGTGGLSHWVGVSSMGTINTDFDHRFLEIVRSGDLDAAVGLSNDELVSSAGNGTPEIRNWVSAMACGSSGGVVLAYEPIVEWATGIAVARLFGGGSA